jgi:hypothetical protein
MDWKKIKKQRRSQARIDRRAEFDGIPFSLKGSDSTYDVAIEKLEQMLRERKLPPSLTPEQNAQVEDVFKRVEGVLGTEKAMAWMTTGNPHLGGAAPIKMILLGRGEKLLKIVQSMIEGDTP